MPHHPTPSRRTAAAVAAVCLGVALLGVASPASAADTEAAISVAASVDATSPLVTIDVPAGQAASAVAHWTPERRAAAIDDDTAADASAAPAADGTDSTPASGDDADPLAASAAVASNDKAVQIAPVSHIGRIYYEQAGYGHYCTANVVESANRSTIATAGHCVTQDQVFSINMVFYPAYESGESAYGAWPVVGGNVTSGWYERNDDDQGDDSAFMAVARNDDGADVQSVVGASPVLFDQPADERASAYGYPAVGRFDGNHLDRCTGQGEAVSTEQIALPCDMTGGVSGGPILAGDSPDGAQFANVAEMYADASNNLGPVWKDVEHSAYDATAAIAT